MTESTTLHLDDRPFNRWVLTLWTPHGVSARAAITLALIANCLIFYFASRWFGFPVLPGFDGSIFCQPSPITAFLLVAILLAIGAFVGTFIAGAVRFEAGLFAACFAMTILSQRCGNMQEVLFEAGGDSSVFYRLAAELLVLGLLLAAIWAGLWAMAKAAHSDAPPPPATGSTLVNNLTATIAQTVATAVIVFVLCQAPAKNQVQASIGIASWLGAMIAYKYAPARPSFWFWIGPILVGLIGYILAAAGQDSTLQVGVPTGPYAPFARPLPLDYAGIGVAASILGYWMMRKADIGVGVS
jgi:hypothetical protein